MPDSNIATMDLTRTDQWHRMGQAIRWLADRAEDAPSLTDAAAAAGLSASHFQRVFSRWVGVSPKQFVRALSAETAKDMLRRSTPVLEAAFEAGLSGPGRLHDLIVTMEAMTPGDYAREGAGLSVRYGVATTPLGRALIGVTDRGVCSLGLLDPASEQDAVAWLKSKWRLSHLVRDDAAAQAVADQAFVAAHPDRPLHLLVKGTNFQIQVWRALLAIPEGSLTCYRRIAEAVNKPTAARAVGAAVGANMISYLIPCHRVLRESGALSGYAWGLPWKRSLIAWEAARTTREAAA